MTTKLSGQVGLDTENMEVKLGKANEIKRLFGSAMESWVKAGELVVSMIDEDATTSDVISRMTGLDIAVINKLERLGRQQIIPELLTINPMIANTIGRLTYSEQKRVVEEGVDVLAKNGKTTMHLNVKSLTQKQCHQAFDATLGVRDVEAQRSWQERVKAPPAELVGMPYQIVNGEVIFNKGCRLKRKEIEAIVKQLPRK